MNLRHYFMAEKRPYVYLLFRREKYNGGYEEVVAVCQTLKGAREYAERSAQEDYNISHSITWVNNTYGTFTLNDVPMYYSIEAWDIEP